MKNHFVKSGMNRESEPFAGKLLRVKGFCPLENTVIAFHAVTFMKIFMLTGFLNGSILLRQLKG